MSLRSRTARYCLLAIALGSASFLALLELHVVDVADRGDLDARNQAQRLHQVWHRPPVPIQATESVSLAA